MLPSYQVVSNEITSALTTGVKQNLSLFHPKSSKRDVLITEIGVNVRIVQTAGTFAWELDFISAENGTPGGTQRTPQPLNGGPASELVVREVVTGAPTGTGAKIQRASFPLPAAATPFVQPEGFIIFRAQDEDERILLPAGADRGINVTQNVLAALTTAPVFSVYVRFIEQ